MLAWSFVRTMAFTVVGCATSALALGCVVTNDPSGGGGYGGGSGGSSGGGSGSSSGGGSTQPMLVDVDPDQTMNATPGDGVGVFVEYKTGGHWHVWWTCDTNKTGLSCSFDNLVTASTGDIENLVGQALESSDTLTQSGKGQVEALTTTTTGVDGMTFDTPFSSGTTPIITLTMKLNGIESAQFGCQNGGGNCNVLFFVQDGQIDGNYQGSLTDPLMLEPKLP